MDVARLDRDAGLRLARRGRREVTVEAAPAPAGGEGALGSRAPRREGAARWAADRLITLAVGAAVFGAAYDGGSYGEASRDTIAIGLWWALAVGLAAGVFSLSRLPRACLLCGGLLGAYAAWSATSIGWSTSAEAAYTEFTRVALFLATFAFVALVSRRADAGRWSDGIALGISATAVVALWSRLFPDVVSLREARILLPGSYIRLSYPLGYWNGLAIFVALGLPLLLRAALTARSPITRGLALAPVPAIAVVIYLTSSRGGAAAAVIGIFLFVLLAERRVAALATAALSCLAAGLAVLPVSHRIELVNGPLESAAARSEGHTAAAILLGVCLALAAVYAAGSFLLARARVPAALNHLAVPALLLAAGAGAAAAHPLRRFHAFKQPPSNLSQTDFVRAHLLAGSGSGRWQQWAAAINEWRSERLHGRGAGSYEAWWSQHGGVGGFIKDAHSLYAEVLGELGVIGFGLIVGAFACAVLVAAVRLRKPSGDLAIAAFVATLIAWAVAAAVDWIWELTAVAFVAIALLALLTGRATEAMSSDLAYAARPALWPRLVASAACLALAAAQALPLLGGIAIRRSQRAIARGDIATAVDQAAAATRIEPWAASPRAQLALVYEQIGNLRAARLAIGAATRRDPENWRLWLIRARVETAAGAIGAARRSIHSAVALHPNSPLFALPR